MVSDRLKGAIQRDAAKSEYDKTVQAEKMKMEEKKMKEDRDEKRKDRLAKTKKSISNKIRKESRNIKTQWHGRTIKKIGC